MKFTEEDLRPLETRLRTTSNGIQVLEILSLDGRLADQRRALKNMDRETA